MAELCTMVNVLLGKPRYCKPTLEGEKQGTEFTDKKTDMKGTYFYTSVESNLLSENIEFGAPCGEFSCMEILAIIDPSIKRQDIWMEFYKHRS